MIRNMLVAILFCASLVHGHGLHSKHLDLDRGPERFRTPSGLERAPAHAPGRRALGNVVAARA
jgi:hypothetical protein